MSKPQKVTITLEDNGTNTSASIEFDPEVSLNAADSFAVYAGLKALQAIHDLMNESLEDVEDAQ